MATQSDEKVLILAELANGEIASVTLESARIGRDIADQVGARLCAALLGSDVDPVAEKIAWFADQVYLLNHALLKSFQADLFARALEDLCREIEPFIVLMGHNLQNLSLAPKLAYRLGAEIVTDCVSLRMELPGRRLLATKPVFGAKFLSTFDVGNKRCVITLRSRSVQPIDPCSTHGTITAFSPNLDPSLVKVKSIRTIREQRADLDKADAIVSGGRGVKDTQGLQLLLNLVLALRKHFDRVELGASRPLVDLHLVPSSRQIGLTGKIVAPQLYLAIGISGSLQHITGIERAKKIIAINVDPKANIFKVADYGIVGGYEDVLPALTRKLEELG